MLARYLPYRAVNVNRAQYVRTFSTASNVLEKALPPRRKIADDEIIESFLKGTGPGGQKINKTNSAVQLKHIPTGIVVKSQETRSREQNRKYARQILGEKLDQLENGEQSRTAIKAERASKKKASAVKKARRKYKKAAEEKAALNDGNAELSEHETGISNEAGLDHSEPKSEPG